MPNLLDATGLQTASRAELIATFNAGLQAIYGADINLDSDSPDGQMVEIFVQAVLDLEDLLVQIYNSFDPASAIGVQLDQRCAINGVQRQAGTFTKTDITLVVDRTLNLDGLDTAPNAPYTVQDNAGNQWQLTLAQVSLGIGSHALPFQAANAGAVLTVPNTITVPVTVVLGVTSINNPTLYTTLGLNEETDAQLRVRRAKSVSLSSQGYLQGLLAALLNVRGVTAAYVYENNTGSTDADGIPGHSIWVIVNGGADVDIATAIYNKRNACCGMKGAVTHTVLQLDNTNFTIKWDVVTTETLFSKATLSSIDGVNTPDPVFIATKLAAIMTLGVNQTVNINELATLIQQIDPNALVTSAGFSVAAGGSYTNKLAPTAKNYQFTQAAANVILLPMIITPSTLSIAHGGSTATFAAVGGHGAIAYSIAAGTGSVNSSTGVYTSPGSAGSATVRATDALGNTVDAAVTIT